MARKAKTTKGTKVHEGKNAKRSSDAGIGGFALFSGKLGPIAYAPRTLLT